MGPGRALFSGRRLGFRCALFDQLLGLAQILCNVAGRCSDGGLGRIADKVMLMNPEQLQSLAVLALAMVPVGVLWWVWIRMLR